MTPPTPTRKITVRLDEVLLAHVDLMAGERGETRNAFVAQVLALVAGAGTDVEIRRRVEKLFVDRDDATGRNRLGFRNRAGHNDSRYATNIAFREQY